MCQKQQLIQLTKQSWSTKYTHMYDKYIPLFDKIEALVEKEAEELGMDYGEVSSLLRMNDKQFYKKGK